MLWPYKIFTATLLHAASILLFSNSVAIRHHVVWAVDFLCYTKINDRFEYINN